MMELHSNKPLQVENIVLRKKKHLLHLTLRTFYFSFIMLNSYINLQLGKII